MDASSHGNRRERAPSNNPVLGSAQFRFAQLMDSNKDSVVQRATGPIDITEVAKHTSENDCWTIYKGKVYDITRYLDMHPGGRQHLLDYAGMDITEEFSDIHPWVNAEFLLKSLYVGELKSEDVATDLPPTKGTAPDN
ncbi:cytochrome b5-like Heme Steroid binding domain containing protein [Babesia ovis]|uniref:Cytochrome b5-like Heme Steroid binding domain containing protein n=1 Tax=Babesia ovis TaxID=5869 RepID=A0A9W5TDY9_BABOV|nr:cytochrome b5-like Heme Steroid binding domain containing protein [Babesia ovis]